jgi:pumilio family protein 6
MVLAKNTKKRQAPTKLQSQPKRRSTEKEIPAKSTATTTTEKKRSRPVTHVFPIIEESDSDLEDEAEEGDDDDVNMDDDGEDEIKVDVDANPTPKDPNGMSLLYLNTSQKHPNKSNTLSRQRITQSPKSTSLTTKSSETKLDITLRCETRVVPRKTENYSEC